ncbi:SDR family NAD(P)-dependent oxidoreductase [Cryobacterium sp. PH29-G1]|uniref:SDR family NAD(P)-dependent oxidoreductase n=1 Tax=Cryobacterium sp. PH29-G1 TaxID=3046211 RepID=UPI0024BB8147|nr:SDR family NAD(P)-dependent oxidoreductase [Cryobacterium sp. PH29-G1]MDJ0349662.1 SDR family NAD(P)-dependent oxidoreductase [Cryobacterium sp. PH29-G1]
MNSTVVIVTGAAGGLGSAIAARVADDFDVVLVTDIQEKALQAVVERIGASSRARVISHVCDVSDPDQVTALFERANQVGAVTGLVNAAGIGGFCGIEELLPQQWDRVFEINTKGTFLMSQAFVRVATAPASIVNISSIGARSGNDVLAHYGASKAAVIELSHSFARGYGRKGIRSNAIMPGFIYTDMWRNSVPFMREHNPALADVTDEQIFAGIVDQNVPMGRPQEPEDIAEATAFFLSERAKNITGQTLAVDGGTVLT